MLKTKGAMSITKLVIIMLSILCESNCGFTPGLHRTSLEKWDKRIYDTIGISVELPKKTGIFSDAYLERIYDKDYNNQQKRRHYKNILIMMHEIITPAILDDAVFLIHLDFVRMRPSEFEKFKRGESFNNFLWEFNEPIEFEPQLIERKKRVGRLPRFGDHLFFRRDIKMSNGDVLVNIGDLWISYVDETPQTINQDILAIKRILNSIQALKGHP